MVKINKMIQKKTRVIFLVVYVIKGPVIIYGGEWYRREIGWVDKISHKIKVG